MFAALYNAFFIGVFPRSFLVELVEGTVDCHRGKTIIIGVSLTGLGFSVAAVIPSTVTYPFTLVFGALVVGGAGNSVMQIAYRTFLQRTIPNNKRGHVFSLVQICSSIGTPLSIALTAPIMKIFGPMTTLGAMGWTASAQQSNDAVHAAVRHRKFRGRDALSD